MSGSVNRVIIVGNLGRDPEVRTMQNGERVANLNVATSETWRDKNSGERREKTEWHRVVVFGKTAEIAGQYLRKGSKVYLEGQLQTRKWTDQQGAEKYSTEVVLRGFNGVLTMLDSREGGHGAEPHPSAHGKQDGVYDDAEVAGGGDLSDEIPFAAEWRG